MKCLVDAPSQIAIPQKFSLKSQNQDIKDENKNILKFTKSGDKTESEESA